MTDAANGHPRSELSAYLDDQLGVDERTAVDRHLASCEDCRAELAALRLLAAAVAAEAVPPVPSDLAVRIGKRIDAAAVVRFPKRRFVVPVTIAATLGAIGLLLGASRFTFLDMLQPSVGLHGVNLRRLMDDPALVRSVLETLISWTAAGEIKPEPGRVMALEDVGIAHRLLEKRMNVGKIVLRVGE